MIGPVTMCANCNLPVHQVRKYDPRLCAPMPPGRGRVTVTGWDHWGFWQGVRCAGKLCGAEPGRVIGEDEYLAWLDERIERRRQSLRSPVVSDDPA